MAITKSETADAVEYQTTVDGTKLVLTVLKDDATELRYTLEITVPKASENYKDHASFTTEVEDGQEITPV